MEAQREREPGAERRGNQESTTSTTSTEALPPPPTAFPINEFSRLHSQLVSTHDPPISGTARSSPELAEERDPFGDSNAASRASLASTSISHSENPFRQRGEDHLLRDDGSSIGPPPDYEEFHGSDAKHGQDVGDARIGSNTALPSYTAFERDGDVAEKEEREVGPPQALGATPTPTARNQYPEEKADHKEDQGKDLRNQQHQQRDAVPEMQERTRAELSAISDAIARAYASAPSLDNQRYTPPTSRPSSGIAHRQGESKNLGETEPGTLGAQSIQTHSERGDKGKQRGSEGASEGGFVVIEGRRMSRGMAAELFQIWDNIDRAHGYWMSEQSQVQDPVKEAAKLEEKKEAFYRELISKNGQRRLSSQDHLSRTLQYQGHQPYFPDQDSSEAFIGPSKKLRHPFQPLRTPESEKSSPKMDGEDSPNMAQTLEARAATPEAVATSRRTAAATGATQQGDRAASHGREGEKTSEEELVTLEDFIRGTEEELITVHDFLKKEIGKE